MESQFVELSDRTIINVNDIILVNVDEVSGKYVYRLYLRGKGMTLKLIETDYNIIRDKLLNSAKKK